MSRAPKQKVPESSVLRACLDLLVAEKVWHRRWNTGAVKADKRFFRFGQKGDADILAILRIATLEFGKTEVLWIECKSDSGAQTRDQRMFQIEVEGQGHNYLLARSSDDLKNWLRTHRVTGVKSAALGVIR